MQHLVAWAQIGVLLRVYLAELFGSACPHTAWAPCLTSSGSRWGGPFFTDLPANIAGSFLMGLFVSSDVLSNSLKHILTVEAPMAMLPVRSPLQEHVAFQVSNGKSNDVLTKGGATVSVRAAEEFMAGARKGLVEVQAAGS